MEEKDRKGDGKQGMCSLSNKNMIQGSGFYLTSVDTKKCAGAVKQGNGGSEAKGL